MRRYRKRRFRHRFRKAVWQLWSKESDASCLKTTTLPCLPLAFQLDRSVLAMEGYCHLSIKRLSELDSKRVFAYSVDCPASGSSTGCDSQSRFLSAFTSLFFVRSFSLRVRLLSKFFSSFLLLHVSRRQVKVQLACNLSDIVGRS